MMSAREQLLRKVVRIRADSRCIEWFKLRLAALTFTDIVLKRG